MVGKDSEREIGAVAAPHMPGLEKVKRGRRRSWILKVSDENHYRPKRFQSKVHTFPRCLGHSGVPMSLLGVEIAGIRIRPC